MSSFLRHDLSVNAAFCIEVGRQMHQINSVGDTLK